MYYGYMGFWIGVKRLFGFSRNKEKLDTEEYINKPIGRVRKLARIPNHISRLRPKMFSTRPWLTKLSTDFNTLTANFIVIENKSRANYMVAKKESLLLLGMREVEIYLERLATYLKEIDASQALNLRYQNELTKRRNDSAKEVRAALRSQRGETLVMFKKLGEIDHTVEAQIKYMVAVKKELIAKQSSRSARSAA